jgi:hypothetical protein
MATRASSLLAVATLLATTFALPALAGGFRVTDVASTVRFRTTMNRSA